MKNWDIFIAAVGRITQWPELWDQRKWTFQNGCGCVLSHCMNIIGKDPGIERVNRLTYNQIDWAKEFFRISENQARYLFCQDRTLEELQYIAISKYIC